VPHDDIQEIIMKKNTRNTKGKIVSAAWKLFYQQGYENTTVEDIIFESGTSKGSFYHYFESKDALLSTLSTLFDEKYEEIMQDVDPHMNSVDLLVYLNKELFEMVEKTVSIDLLQRLLSSQLVTKGDRHLLDRNRTYFKVLRKVIADGQEKGEIRKDISVNRIMKAYAMMERGLMYDWCLSEGDYALAQYSEEILKMFCENYREIREKKGKTEK